MKKVTRSIAASVPVPDTANLSWSGRIGARCGLLNNQFAKKFFQPRRFQTWYKPGLPAFTRVSQSGNGLYHDLVERYRPPATHIQRRFESAARGKNWQPLDLALPGQVSAAPAQVYQPDLASLLMGTPLEKSSTGAFPPVKHSAPAPASAGQVIPRKENDPDFALNRTGGKPIAAPEKARKLPPNQRLFSHVEEVHPGKEAAPKEAATQDIIPNEPSSREAAPTVEAVEKPGPSQTPAEPVRPGRRMQLKPESAASTSATVQREMAAPPSPRREKDEPAAQTPPVLPIAQDLEKPVEPRAPVAEIPAQPPVEEKPAVLARPRVEKEPEKIVEPVHDRPAHIAARPATIRPEVANSTPRQSPPAMPAHQPAQRAPDKASFARLSVRPVMGAPAQVMRKQTGLVQREFTPGVRPFVRKPRPRLSLGSQRTLSPLIHPTKPANLPLLGLQKLLPLSPARRSSSARPSGSSPARDSSVYLASPEQASTPAAPSRRPQGRNSSAYQAFPDRPAPVMRPKLTSPSNRPPASKPSVYLASPEQPPASAKPPKRPMRAASAYTHFPDQPAPTAPSRPAPTNPRPAEKSSIYLLSSEQSPKPSQPPKPSPARAPSAYAAFGSLPMPLAKSNPAPETSQTLSESAPHWQSGGYTDGKEEPPSPTPDRGSGAYIDGSDDAQEESSNSQSGEYTVGKGESQPETRQQSNYYTGGNSHPSQPATADSRPPVYLTTSYLEPEIPQRPGASEQDAQPPSESSAAAQVAPSFSSPAQSQADGAQPAALDFDRIARQVYPLILRKLRVERERQAGHLH